MTLNQNLLNKRNRYYKNYQVEWELVKAMKNREVVFMDGKDNRKIIRGIFINHPEQLRKAFEIFGFYRKNENIYISVAKYNHIPIFTPNLSKRSEFTNLWFRNEAKKEFVNYDLLLDIDIRKQTRFTEIKKKTLLLLRALHRYEVPFYFYPSGTGFHIIIPAELVNFPREKHKLLIKEFQEKLEYDFIDSNGIGNLTKIRKCPYSLVDDRICLPIDNYEHFLNWYQYDLTDSNDHLFTTNFRNRGLKIINLSYLENGTEKFNNFLSDFGFNEV